MIDGHAVDAMDIKAGLADQLQLPGDVGIRDCRATDIDHGRPIRRPTLLLAGDQPVRERKGDQRAGAVDQG